MFDSPPRIDTDILDWVLENRTEPLTTLAHIITVGGNTLPLLGFGVVVTIALFATKHVREAVFFAVGSLLGLAAMAGLKELFARERPLPDHRLLEIESYSFPSGHAMMSTIVYGLVAIACHRAFTWVQHHRLIVLIAPLLAIAIGLTRIYLGVHWFTDVATGWFAGVLWVLACWGVLRATEPKTTEPRTTDPNTTDPNTTGRKTTTGE